MQSGKYGVMGRGRLFQVSKPAPNGWSCRSCALARISHQVAAFMMKGHLFSATWWSDGDALR